MYSNLGQPLTMSRYRGSAASPNPIAKSAYFRDDDFHRLQGLTHKNPADVALASYSWDFDKGDRLTTVAYQYGSATYTYDATDQIKLGSHVYSNPATTINETYTYDANGNRTGAFASGQGNRLGTYTSGTLTERVAYTWDHRNRLTAVNTYDAVEVSCNLYIGRN